MSQTLYLVHHGDALASDVDPQRPLSSAGRARVEDLARAAAAHGVKPDIVWHSGKLRARQTAEAFWRACHPLAEFSATRGLQPTDPSSWVVDQVTGETRAIMLVGHMPNLDRVLQLLLRGEVDGTSGFPPHGIVELECHEDHWIERWRLGPT